MQLWKVSLVLVYAYPISLWTVLLFSSLVPRGRRGERSEDLKKNRYYKIVWTLQCLLVLCFCVSAFLSISPYVTSISQHGNIRLQESYLVSYIALSLYFAAGLLPDPDGPFQPSTAHNYAWLAGMLLEIAVLVLNLQFQERTEATTATSLALSGCRAAILLCMCIAYTSANGATSKWQNNYFDSERLLSNGQPNYGTNNKPPAIQEQFPRPKRGGWMDYLIGFRILFPYLWPSDSYKQQLILVASLFLLIGQRVVNIMVPYQLEQLISALGEGKKPYKEVVLYTTFRGLQGQQGVLGSFRAFLWIPLSQSLFKRLICAAFRHILSLSLDFHLSNRVGEVLSALSKGSALNTFLDSFAFQLFPMVFDLGVAATYFLIRLDPLYSLIILAVMWCYIYITIYMAMWRTKARREMATKDREMNAVQMDTVMSYETVHHNNAVQMETERFGGHVQDYQQAEWQVLTSLNLLNITQNTVLIIGILIVVLISAFQISVGLQSVATFVGILGYFTQLQAPLQFFGSFYSQVQNNLVDSERMLDLFKIKPNIVDKEGASDVPYCEGGINFSNVSFAYDNRKPAIKNVSFAVDPGTSTAIVGESGSGKSTLLRLLFRFYDVTSGSVRVDGKDIRDMKLDSVRDHIGVVPQDTILFNTSIFYNLQYSKPDASADEIYNACKAASIHDRILSFPEAYDTKVGERGLKLSGGEKQRISIARAILKDPQIMLFDEATASLDSHTEKQIQNALGSITKGRTTIVIAHRLSTITECDQILVLHQGRIVERGTHEFLIEKGGMYKGLWDRQTKLEHSQTEKSDCPGALL